MALHVPPSCPHGAFLSQKGWRLGQAGDSNQDTKSRAMSPPPVLTASVG